MPVNATVNVTKVIVKKQGRKGLPGLDGTDGIGINTVRMAKINNPVSNLFKKNLITLSMFGVMTFTRNDTALLQDRSGVLKTVVADIPREYPQGWLIEGTSTNLVVNSEDFSNASWTKTNVTVVTDTTDAPDLATTGDTLTQTVAGGSVSDTVTISADLLTKTASVFLKQGTAPTSMVRLSMSGGTPSDTDTDITWSTIDSNANAEKLTGGWYRINVSALNANNTTALITIFPDTSDSSLTVIAWGGQLEQGVLSSYILTTGSTSNRLIESLTTEVFGNIPSISSEWSFFARVQSSALDGYILEHENSQFAVFIDSDSKLSLTTDAGTTFVLSTVVDFSVSKPVSINYDGANLTAWIDGVEQLTVVTVFTTISDGLIRYGNNFAGSAPSFCQLLDVRWYDFSLNDSENEFLAG